MKEKLNAKIVEISRNTHTAAYLEQGVKKQRQGAMERTGAIGGCGSYVTGFEYLGTTIDVTLQVYDLNKRFSVDVRDYLLAAAGKSRISAKRLERLIKDNKWRKVVVERDNGRLTFDPRQLKI